MEAANAFLSQFIDAYNEKFGVEPENPEELSELLILISILIIFFVSRIDEQL